MEEKNGYEQAVADAAEVEILEGHQKMREDL